jgi:RNA polymerase sigma-B factor
MAPATARHDERAATLITELSALPAGHPDRPALRAETLRAWLPMAERLAQRYAGRGEPIEDLRQTATVGLIKAVDRFDPQFGTEFTAYAVPTILGEIRRYFRDRGWSVRVPRRLQELWLAINEANGACQARLGRTPTIADLAAYLKISEEEVIEGLEGSSAYRATSLSTPISADGALELGDLLGGDDHGYVLTEMRLDLGPALATLTERERRIVTLRFYGNQTQTQIAEQIGVSQMHVSRLLAASLAKLSKALTDRGAAV